MKTPTFNTTPQSKRTRKKSDKGTILIIILFIIFLIVGGALVYVLSQNKSKVTAPSKTPATPVAPSTPAAPSKPLEETKELEDNKAIASEQITYTTQISDQHHFGHYEKNLNKAHTINLDPELLDYILLNGTQIENFVTKQAKENSYFTNVELNSNSALSKIHRYSMRIQEAGSKSHKYPEFNIKNSDKTVSRQLGFKITGKIPAHHKGELKLQIYFAASNSQPLVSFKYLNGINPVAQHHLIQAVNGVSSLILNISDTAPNEPFIIKLTQGNIKQVKRAAAVYSFTLNGITVLP